MGLPKLPGICFLISGVMAEHTRLKGRGWMRNRESEGPCQFVELPRALGWALRGLFLPGPPETNAAGVSALAKRPSCLPEGSWSGASVLEAEAVLVARHQLPDRPWHLLSGLPLKPFGLKAGPRSEKG